MTMAILFTQSQVRYYDFPFLNNFVFFLELISTLNFFCLFFYLPVYRSFFFRLSHCTVRLAQYVQTLGNVSFSVLSHPPALIWTGTCSSAWGFPFPSVLYFPLSLSLAIIWFLWVHGYFIHLLPFL